MVSPTTPATHRATPRGAVLRRQYAGARVSGWGQGWLNFLQGQGPGGSNLWGGTVAFDTMTNWYFGSSAGAIGATQVDFLSCAEHDLGHALGIAPMPNWFAQVSGRTFTGSHAETVSGGPLPLTWANSELADVTVAGVQPVMDLGLKTGTRRTAFTPLD